MSDLNALIYEQVVVYSRQSVKASPILATAPSRIPPTCLASISRATRRLLAPPTIPLLRHPFSTPPTRLSYLPGTSGWGPSYAGRPAVLWNPQVQTTDGSFGVRQNQFGFDIAGTLDIPLVIEASTALAPASWLPLQTCTLTNGLLYFSDPQWTNYSKRFYRIRSP